MRRVAGLAGERGAAAARQNREAVLARQRERAHHVAFVARDHDAQRDLPVIRSVGGVERERGVVEANLAVDGAAEFALSSHSVRGTVIAKERRPAAPRGNGRNCSRLRGQAA